MSDPRDSQSIFMRGAVDLSALRSQPAAQPAQASAGSRAGQGQPAGAGGAVMIDVTEATFQSEVLERSLHTPVVIDFWAEWCGPCKQLSPVLEKLATEYAGAWVLARVDVDANPRLAQMFRVQGIPMVYAVAGGQPVDAFTGVVPEAQLRQWLDAVLEAAGGAAPAPAADPRLEEADEALRAGDLDGAERAFQKILSEAPGNAAAEAGVAQVHLARRVQGVDRAAALAAADAAPDDVDAQLTAADLEVLGGDAEAAYRRLVDLVRRAPPDRDRVREHLVSLFAMAAPDDPAVAAARRSLASALF